MATKRFNGVLDAPIFGDFYDGKLRFTHLTTTGNVLAASQSFESLVVGGVYDFELNYGTIVIESKVNGGNWHIHGAYTVNSSTTATTLPALLLATTPVTPEIVQQLEAILADAEASAAAARVSEQNAAASAASIIPTIGDVSPANLDWDLFIPFNDSGKIERGFGEHDTIDVSAAQDGSTLVELPTKSVSFSRASARTVVNKSGEVETIAVDKLAIGSDGAEFYQSYTNTVKYSENLTTSWILFPPAALTTRTIESGKNPDGSDGVVRITNSSAVTGSFGIYQSTAFSTSLLVDTSFWIRASKTMDVRVGTDAGSFRRTVGTDWTRVSSNAIRASSNFVIFPIGSGDASEYVEVWGAQATETASTMPYIKTESSAVTSAADICSFTIKSNLPQAGKPFSIMCDTAFHLNYRSEAWAVIPSDSSVTSIAFLLRRDGTTNEIQFYLDDADGSDRVVSVSDIDESRHRFICTYDGLNTTKIYIDGELRGQSAAHGAKSYAGLGVIRLGRSSTSGINNAIKNFGIIHRALSDDEIKALGAAK